jgi:ABC-2 type transport system permease protein
VQITVPVPTVADAVDQFLKNAQTELFVAVLLVMRTVATEKERGTAGLVLTKPVGRATFLAAKFAALTLLFLAGMAVAGMAMYGYTAYLFGALPVGGFIACCLLLLVALLVYAAVTFLGSTIARGPVGAAGIGLGYFALMAVLGALPGMGRFTPGGLFACARQSALGVWTRSHDPPRILAIARRDAAQPEGEGHR